jgi:hypothetical protein
VKYNGLKKSEIPDLEKKINLPIGSLTVGNYRSSQKNVS